MFKIFKKIVGSTKVCHKKCRKDSTKCCTYDYSFDRNGALVINGNLFGCCKIQDQIRAAKGLHDLAKKNGGKLTIPF